MPPTGRWAQMRLPVAEALAEIAVSCLSSDQQARLALAWMRIYVAGGASGAPPDDWRRALGYSASEWEIACPAFSDALREASGLWSLPFMRAEVDRQHGVSQKQAERAGMRWHALASQGNAVECPASASSLESDLKLTPLNGMPTHATARQENRDWQEAFDQHVWPVWLGLGRGTGKAAALAVFMRIQPKTQETFDQIHGALEKDSAVWKTKDPQYVPHAKTWLTQKRYLDHAEATHGT